MFNKPEPEVSTVEMDREELLEIRKGAFDVLPTPEEEHEEKLIKQEVARYKATYQTAFSNQ